MMEPEDDDHALEAENFFNQDDRHPDIPLNAMSSSSSTDGGDGDGDGSSLWIDNDEQRNANSSSK